MTTTDLLLYILKPIDFMEEERYITWTVAWSTVSWLIFRRFVSVHTFTTISIALWYILIIAGSILALCLLAWILFIPKDHQGLSLVAGLISALPILLPAIAAAFYILLPNGLYD